MKNMEGADAAKNGPISSGMPGLVVNTPIKGEIPVTRTINTRNHSTRNRQSCSSFSTLLLDSSSFEFVSQSVATRTYHESLEIRSFLELGRHVAVVVVVVSRSLWFVVHLLLDRWTTMEGQQNIFEMQVRKVRI